MLIEQMQLSNACASRAVPLRSESVCFCFFVPDSKVDDL